MEAWIFTVDFSADEQTVGFQDNHTNKLRITDKAEVGGFQCDALFRDGCTFTFYFCNQPASKKFQPWFIPYPLSCSIIV